MSRVNYPDVIKKTPFGDPVFFAQCEEDAIDGTLNYDDYPAAEYKYFSKLSKLGYMNRHKGWSKEICEAKQKDLLTDYTRERDDREFFGNISRQMQENIKRGQELTWQINDEPDPVRKLALALECIGCMTGDEGFARRNSNDKT